MHTATPANHNCRCIGATCTCASLGAKVVNLNALRRNVPQLHQPRDRYRCITKGCGRTARRGGTCPGCGNETLIPLQR